MIIVYFFTLLLLSVYSYSQIDLNLTLLQNQWFLNFQSLMINLGYYNRPASTLIFVILISLLFFFYWKFLPAGRQGKLAIGIIGLFGLVSYPFLSYDLFNYIFDARIVTMYGQNPYFFKALDFPNDTWIRFMHWTHRTYPYGPVWLLTTLVPSYLGMGKFLLTFLNFKILFVGIYFLNCWLINKINTKALRLFAFNPLIILETIYSPHNEALMLCFLLMAVYLYKNKWISFLNLVLSGGVKFLTWGLIPIRFLNREKFIKFSLILTSLYLIPVVIQREVYPWYFVTILGLASLIDNRKLWLSLNIFALGSLLQYVPFIFVGDYGPAVTISKNIILLVSSGLALGVYLLALRRRLFEN